MNCFEFKPVGQGLFYIGSLMHDTYNFVYDCGTVTDTQYVNKQIDAYVQSFGKGKDYKPHIDFVVISHLHKDHYSGLQYLLEKCDVQKIYLPYLDADDTLIQTTIALSIFANSEGTVFEDKDENWVLIYFMCGLYGVGESNDFKVYREKVVFLKDIKCCEEGIDGNVYSYENFTAGYEKNPYWQFSLIQSRTNKSRLYILSTALSNYFAQLGSHNLPLLIHEGKISLDVLKTIYERIFGRGNYVNLTSIILVHFPLYFKAKVIYTSKSFGKHVEKIL